MHERYIFAEDFILFIYEIWTKRISCFSLYALRRIFVQVTEMGNDHKPYFFNPYLMASTLIFQTSLFDI